MANRHDDQFSSSGSEEYLELRQVARRIHNPSEHRKKAFDRNFFLSVVKDFKIYLLILAFWSNVTPNYGLKFTMPQIITNMGYTSANAQLLTIPAYTVDVAAAYCFAIVSDRYRWRMPFIVGPQVAVVIVYAILASKAADIKNNIAVCYFAISWLALGKIITPWDGITIANVCPQPLPHRLRRPSLDLGNLAGPSKRAEGIGYLTCFGNTGGIMGSFIFIDKDKPTYKTGFGSSLGFASAWIVACLVLELAL